MTRYNERFSEPIQINAFYFNREIFEFLSSVTDYKTRLQMYENFIYWALYNEENPNQFVNIPNELKQQLNELIGNTTYAGLNKYRWDFYYGKRGGRPKRENDFI